MKGLKGAVMKGAEKKYGTKFNSLDEVKARMNSDKEQARSPTQPSPAQSQSVEPVKSPQATVKPEGVATQEVAVKTGSSSATAQNSQEDTRRVPTWKGRPKNGLNI